MIKHECGVFGIYDHEEAARLAYFGLYAQQHRGQESCGIAVNDRGVIAILDSRMATARYGGFLQSSLPPYWSTTDPVRVRSALERLAASS